ncbi:ABC transporter [Thermocladium modestius]|uniref:ABC transporter n=1 Tax=Thermocladium modestius TaxID=62609 RepID=A0A830GW14_9CREN|nr:ATP-binding cassette domain-containing protein [Thermocladium modestius]GGP20988.1 ABC transporter [Thermocladium modestius]
MIELRDTTISVGGGAFVVRNVNMEVNGKAVLIGPNGSGKSTLLRAICGLIPYEGSIKIDGMEVNEVRGYTPLSCNLSEIYQMALTISGLLEILEDVKGVDRREFKGILGRFNISYESIEKKPVFGLSAGQSAIVKLALALASRPKIVIADEPFENVDPARRLMVSSLLMEYGEEGMIVTHELDMLRRFSGYDAYLVIEGVVYGPIQVERLLRASIIAGESKDALIEVTVGGARYSIVEGGEGVKFSDMGSLNRLYGLLR